LNWIYFELVVIGGALGMAPFVVTHFLGRK